MTQAAQSTLKINPGGPTRRPISAKLLFLKRVGTKAAVINKKGARNQSPRLFKLLRKSFISHIVTNVTHSISIKRSILATFNLSLPSIKTFYPKQNKASGNSTRHCQMQSLVYYTMYIVSCAILSFDRLHPSALLLTRQHVFNPVTSAVGGYSTTTATAYNCSSIASEQIKRRKMPGLETQKMHSYSFHRPTRLINCCFCMNNSGLNNR
jgi:hypothetical protein